MPSKSTKANGCSGYTAWPIRFIRIGRTKRGFVLPYGRFS